MSEPFVGEIRMFAGNFAPRGWAFCDGQLLAVSQNDALFSLLGTIYGGDGRTTFGLPDMRGRVPVHAGSGPGLSPRRLGAKGGAEKETLTVNQLPSHGHPARAANENADNRAPQGALPAIAQGDLYASRQGTPLNFAGEAITAVGGSRSHTNVQPFLCIHFIMALVGIYPSRH
ncbi:MAG TPA: tail fiber protein [Saprospiraceae bacterium]|nr:tail fiber protein [Saprospiraceae bacterium]